MAENKKSCIMYVDLIHTVKKMTDSDAGQLLKHWLMYVNDLNPETDNQIVELVFEPIKQQLKRDLKAWESERTRKSEAGKKGMESRWGKDNTVITEDNSVIKPITPITDTVNVTVTEKKNNEINISFDDFWNLYDKKTGSKPNAKKAWDKLTVVDKQNAFDLCKKYQATCSEKKFIKDAQGYLNQKYWIAYMEAKKPDGKKSISDMTPQEIADLQDKTYEEFFK